MKKIPIKNYLLVVGIAVVTFLLVLYTNAWIKTYKQNQLNMSPFTNNNINEVYKNELRMSLAETNQIILYVGYNDSDDVKALESELLKTIKSKNLNEYILYYNVTDEQDNNEYIETLRKEFVDIKSNINKAPMLIYLKNGVGVEVIDSKDKLITVEDLKSLISKYELGK